LSRLSPLACPIRPSASPGIRRSLSTSSWASVWLSPISTAPDFRMWVSTVRKSPACTGRSTACSSANRPRRRLTASSTSTSPISVRGLGTRMSLYSLRVISGLTETVAVNRIDRTHDLLAWVPLGIDLHRGHGALRYQFELISTTSKWVTAVTLRPLGEVGGFPPRSYVTNNDEIAAELYPCEPCHVEAGSP